MAKRGKRKTSRISKKKRPDFAIVAKRRDYVLNYLKSHPCVDCTEDDIVVLQFDHVRGRKVDNISLMVQLAYDEDVIRSEIAKCEVRCANCHTRKTAREQNWAKTRFI